MNLIFYFSAEKGKTAKIAKDLAERLEQKSRKAQEIQETQAEAGQEVAVIEIKPEVPYSPADLRYLNPLARCNKEKLLKKDIPISPETTVPGNSKHLPATNMYIC